MKRLFPYLLKAKNGVLGTVLLSSAALLVSGLIFILPILPSFFHLFFHFEEIRQINMKDSPEIMDNIYTFGDYVKTYGFKYSESFKPEAVSLIAGTIGFLFLCGNAFRFGTANSASRKSIIGSTLSGLFVTACGMTAVNQLLRLFLEKCTPFYEDTSLYSALFEFQSYDIDFSEAKEVSESFFISNGFITYFLAAFVLLLLVTAIYGLYRRFGLYGSLAGICAATIIYPVIGLIKDSDGRLAQGINSFYFKAEPFYCLCDGTYHCFRQPRASGFVITAAILTAVTFAVYILCMRKTSVRPKGK